MPDIEELNALRDLKAVARAADGDVAATSAAAERAAGTPREAAAAERAAGRGSDGTGSVSRVFVGSGHLGKFKCIPLKCQRDLRFLLCLLPMSTFGT